MKILFIVFNHVLSNKSHIVRLNMSLDYICHNNDVSILCLTNKRNLLQEKKYKHVKFYYHPIKFNWREVKNIVDIVNFINNINVQNKFDLVIQMMEIWDLIRELSSQIEKWHFSVIFHAMPFLWTPQKVSHDFDYDVYKHYITESKLYRKNYIKNHYKEFNKTMSKIGIIAANPTVGYYLKNYCKKLPVSTLESFRLSPIWYTVSKEKNKIYDFVYMARIEKWKWIEYLEKILVHIEKILNRKIKIAILWSIEDFYSHDALTRIKHNENIDVSYLGWCSNKEKKEILSKSKVFLYPSIYDTYSITLAEAVSIGLPCVVRDVLYTKMNYSKVPLVWRIPFWRYKKFAEKAIFLLNNNSKKKEHTLIQKINKKQYFSEIGESDLYSYINSCKHGEDYKL